MSRKNKTEGQIAVEAYRARQAELADPEVRKAAKQKHFERTLSVADEGFKAHFVLDFGGAVKTDVIEDGDYAVDILERILPPDVLSLDPHADITSEKKIVAGYLALANAISLRNTDSQEVYTSLYADASDFDNDLRAQMAVAQVLVDKGFRHKTAGVEDNVPYGKAATALEEIMAKVNGKKPSDSDFYVVEAARLNAAAVLNSAGDTISADTAKSLREAIEAYDKVAPTQSLIQPSDEALDL